jgi:hypothetical protein
MPANERNATGVIGKVALKLTKLPDQDVRLVMEFVDLLEEHRQPESPKPLSPEEIRVEARRRAELLRDVPREQLMARFLELGEEIRQEAIEKGTAIDGDWTGD